MMESIRAAATVNYKETMKKVRLLLKIIHNFSLAPYTL